MRSSPPARANLVRLLLVLGLLATPLGCARPETENPPADPGVTLVFGGRIYLGAPEWRAVDALAIDAGRVVAAGEEQRLARRFDGRIARRVDLRGGVAVPGLHDAHGHFEGYGEKLESVDLVGARSFSEVCERVARRAREREPGTWILGRGWDQNLWEPKRFPHHRELSEVTPDHPVLLERVDGHAAVANARALALAGIDGPQASEALVEGGRVHLGADGRPTGVLIDAAVGLVQRVVPAPDHATRLRRMRLAQDALLAKGLVAVHDMGVGLDTLGLLAELDARGELSLRLYEYLWGNDGLDEAAVRSLDRGAEPDRVRVSGVKLMIDGALGSRGAALLESYSDDPGHRGLLMLGEGVLAARVDQAARLGLQPAIHAIGDRGNRLVLDVYERALTAYPSLGARRPRVEHAQIVARSDWARFEALGLVASMQPTHCTSDMAWVPDRLGPERTLGAYAWRRLVADPGTLAFGSDFPVEDPDPLAGLWAALTRQTADGDPPGGFLPDQRLSAAEALTAFTWGAARAVGAEATRGRLAEGYFADLTVLDVDPLRAAPRELLGARVTMTWIDGEPVYDAR